MSNSKDFIKRLLKYKNILSKLKNLGIVKVFSDNLGDATGLTSSQVRKDFSALKISGNKRGGYQIDDLITSLDSILGKNKPQKVIIVGCGNIGQAMIEYSGFHNESLQIIAGFDPNPEKQNKEDRVPIYPCEEMESFIKANNIKVGIIAVPESVSTEVYKKMTAAGIKGVLNFARVHIREIPGTIVSSVNIELQIENLFYFVNIMEKKKN